MFGQAFRQFLRDMFGNIFGACFEHNLGIFETLFSVNASQVQKIKINEKWTRESINEIFS